MATVELVQAPARRDRRGGITKVASVVTNDRLGANQGVSFMSDGCTFPLPAIGLCYGEVVEEEKTSTGIDIIEAISPPFALYTGVECWLGSDSASDYETRARRLLDQGEDRALEDRLEAWATGGSAVSPSGTGITGALAAVDNALDQQYPGEGVILMNRGDAVKASAEGAIWGWSGVDTVPSTVNGTPIIASGMVAPGTVYGLGAITILKSSVQTINATDHRLNKDWVVAEAIYSIIVDCNYRVKSTATAPGGEEPPPDPDEPLEMNLGSIPSSPIPDGTDTTIIVQTNVAPQNEVYLWYSVNGDPAVEAGEMTQTDSHEFVWNVVGDSTTTGDSVEVWAVSEYDSAPVESNHIIIEVT